MSLTPVPTGTDIQVNTSTASQQRSSSITALNDGGFVVTWSSFDQDGSGSGIYGQRYSSAGVATGTEFRVNAAASNDQLYSSISALADGGFVVTWTSDGQDGSGYGIYGQRYTSAGAVNGGEFRVNTATSSNQIHSSVTTLADGGFVVTWSSDGQDGSGSGIYGQRYTSAGAATGAEFRVNTETSSNQIYSSATALADGGFVVTWSSANQDGSGYGIYGQRYTSAGAATGGEFRVNTVTFVDQIFSSVTALADGGFVVTWTSFVQDGSGSGIYGQRYTSAGAATGAEFRVNTATSNEQSYPSVTALDDGGFAVTWSSYDQDGSDWGIYGQRYAANGSASGTEFRLNAITTGTQVAQTFYGSETVATLADGRLVATWTGSGDEEVFVRLIDVPVDPTPVPTGADIQVNTTTANEQRYSSVTALGDGGFVVTWSSLGQDGSGTGIYGQRYTSAGIATGAEFRVNTATSNDQTYPSVTALDDGGFVVTWSSFLQDGSSWGIYGQRYTSASAAIGAEFRVNTATSGEQIWSSVSALDDGGFVITWSSSSAGQDGSGHGVYGQRYTSASTPTGDEFRVNSATSSTQAWPSVAALSDGGFVVTWSSFGQDGNGYGIYGQRYNSASSPSGGEFRVNTATSGDQLYSSVAALGDGGFVVTWQSAGQDGSGNGIYAQRYTSDGTATGTEFRVNTATLSEQRFSSVTALDDGGFVITWSSLGQDGSGNGIYGQRYAADGSTSGTEFRLNSITDGTQLSDTYYGSETIATLADGRLVATWSGAGQEEVFVRLIDVPATNTPPTITSLATASVAENTTAVIDVQAIDDHDSEGAGLTYAIVLPGAGGAADGAAFTINSTTGVLTFQSAPNFEAPTDNGSNNGYQVTVRVTDSNGATTDQLFNVSVTNVNEAPNAAGPVAVATDEDLAVGGSAATTDVDNATLIYTLATGPAHGGVVLDEATGAFTYTPGSNIDTDASFVVRATDADGLFTDITVNVDVTPVNDTPAAAGPINLTTNEDVAVAGSAATTDVDNATLVYTLQTGPAHGGVSLNGATGAFTFTPGTDADTDTSFVVRATDAGGLFTDITVNVDVTPVNDTPSDIALTGASVNEHAAVGTVVGTFSATDVDAGETFSYQLLNNAGGRFAIGPAGNTIVVADQALVNFETGETADIEVQVTDSGGLTRVETFTIAINDYNRTFLGTARADTLTGLAGDDTLIGLAGNDTLRGLGGEDALIGMAGADRLEGGAGDDLLDGGAGTDTAVFSGIRANYLVTYDADTEAFTISDQRPGAPDGTDTIIGVERFQFADGILSAADVFNDAPIAVALSNATIAIAENASTAAKTQVAIIDITDDNVGTNTITLTGADANLFKVVNGKLYLKAGVTLDHETNPVLDVTVNVIDNSVAGATPVSTSLSIAVTDVNEAPVAVADTNSATEGGAIINGTVADTDPDYGAVLTYAVTNAPIAGLTSFNSATGGYSFDPTVAAYNHLAQGASTNVVVNYTVTDEHGASASSTLTITVTGTNDAPVAVVDTNAANEGGAVIIGTVADTDPDDGAVLSYAVTNGPIAGLTFNNTTGAYTFDPANIAYDYLNAGDTLPIVVNYTVTDQHGASVSSTLTITLTGTNEIQIGDGNANTLTGSAFNDELYGLGGADTLIGNAGNDLLDGGTGIDNMTGGLGDDTYYVDNTDDIVVELTNEGTDLVYSSVDYTLTNNVENLILTGAGNIDGAGNALVNIIYGNSGNNVLDGKGGSDTYYGGAGNDTYFVNTASELSKVFENVGEGNDTIISSVSVTSLADNVENIILEGAATNATGNTLNNTINGNNLANILNGGAGEDVLVGGLGNDTYIVDNVNDVVIEINGQGTDTVQSSVSYTLSDFVENLTLTVGGGAINGTGSAQANTITGNSSVNVLNGGAGNDTLTGGGGADTFMFDTTLNASTNVDTITDFIRGTDKIGLASAIFGAIGGTLDSGELRSGAGFTTAADANDYLIYNSTTGDLYYDADGSGAGAAIKFAKLTTVAPALTVNDFTIV